MLGTSKGNGFTAKVAREREQCIEPRARAEGRAGARFFCWRKWQEGEEGRKDASARKAAGFSEGVELHQVRISAQ